MENLNVKTYIMMDGLEKEKHLQYVLDNVIHKKKIKELEQEILKILQDFEKDLYFSISKAYISKERIEFGFTFEDNWGPLVRCIKDYCKQCNKETNIFLYWKIERKRNWFFRITGKAWCQECQNWFDFEKYVGTCEEFAREIEKNELEKAKEKSLTIYEKILDTIEKWEQNCLIKIRMIYVENGNIKTEYEKQV